MLGNGIAAQGPRCGKNPKDCSTKQDEPRQAEQPRSREKPSSQLGLILRTTEFLMATLTGIAESRQGGLESRLIRRRRHGFDRRQDLVLSRLEAFRIAPDFGLGVGLGRSLFA